MFCVILYSMIKLYHRLKRERHIMRILKNKPNYTEIETSDKAVLFSYTTPVAMFDYEQNIMRITSEKWSKTTSNHINEFKTEWINPTTRVDYEDQLWFDRYVGSL